MSQVAPEPGSGIFDDETGTAIHIDHQDIDSTSPSNEGHHDVQEPEVSVPGGRSSRHREPRVPEMIRKLQRLRRHKAIMLPHEGADEPEARALRSSFRHEGAWNAARIDAPDALYRPRMLQ